MKRTINILIIFIFLSLSGCWTKIYLGKEKAGPEPVLTDEMAISYRAIDPTTVPAGGTWGTVRGILNTNFDNINGTLDSVEVILAEKVNLSDSLTVYVTPDQLADSLSGFSGGSESIDTTSLSARIDLKAPIDNPTFTGTTTGTFSGNLTGNVTGNVSGSAGTIVNSTTSTGGNVALVSASSPTSIHYSPDLQYTELLGALSSTNFLAGSITSGSYYGANSILSLSSASNVDFTITPKGTGVIKKSSTDTLATQAYARQFGGTGTVTLADVQQEISDSLNARIGGGVPIADIAVMQVDSLTKFVTPKQLSDSITANLGGAVGLTLNGGSITLTGDLATADDVTFYTNGDGQYDLPAGGGNLTIMSEVQGWINDSLDVFRPLYLEVTDTASMLSHYAKLSDLSEGGVSLAAVQEEIADSLNAIRSASVQGVALSDSTDLYVTITRLRDSLLVVRDSINVLRSEIDDLWLAFANLGTGDVTAPYVESAELGTYSDSIVVVLMSATDVQQDSVPPVSAFTLYEDAVEMGIADVSINYDTIFIALDSIGVYGAGYTLDYTRTYPMLQDSTGNRTQNFTARAITNNVAEVGGGPENMVTNGTFSTADSWTLGHANTGQGLSITGGHLAFTDLVANDDSYADQAQAEMVAGLESGVNYTLEFDITMVGTGLSMVRFYTNGGGAGITPYGVERGTGHYSINFTAPTISTGGIHIGNFSNGSQGWYIDNVVIYPQE